MEKIKVIILRNEQPEDHHLWLKSCDEFKSQLEYRVVDITKNNWLEEIQNEEFDILLAKPGGVISHMKQLYDERIYILNKVLGYTVYPSAEEIFIYENKKFLSYWLKANNIPYPATYVFYNRKEAEDFLNKHQMPIVAKVNIGAAGSGVSILKSKEDALKYVAETFSGKGARKRSGPNLAKGRLIKRGLHYILHPEDIRKKLNLYRSINSDAQTDFVLFQEFIQHNFEWRIVRIGDSFFGHKKLIINEKASGSHLKGYENPPIEIFDFVKAITDKHQFYSQAVDIFETNNGYLVNEMQCIFGQSDPYQMLIDGKIGRYRFLNNSWIFEEGDYNSNESYDLRLKFVIDSINNERGLIK